MIGLATRGYLRRLYPPDIVLCGPPPAITGASELKPQITGGGLSAQIAPPVIGAARALVPGLQGGPPSTAPTVPVGPTIISGNLLVPVIQGGEED